MIGAYFAYNPHKSFSEFDADICQFLRRGFHRGIVLELAKPGNLIRCGTNLIDSKASTFLSRILKNERTIERAATLGEIIGE